MANIRIKDLPADGAPKQTDLIPIDLGSTRHATVKAVVESGRPTASKAEAEAGVDASKSMTPLTTKQAIDVQVGAGYVPKTVSVIASDGLTGGGALSGDVTVGMTSTNVDRLTKVDSIEAGAQVNTVTSVAGKTGAVTLVAADVNAAPDTLVTDINANTTARHTHANKAILDATTASFLAAEKTKLTGIESGAQVNTVTSVAGKTGAVSLVKGDVGLGNVDNTSDASKPVSTATQTALNAKANSSVTISAGTGLTGGGNLTANRSIALNSASIASLDKADTALQAPGGTTGQVLAKSSAADNDVAWVSSEATTAVSYGPQTLTDPQKTQARTNIASVGYESQTLTEPQKAQARANIGAVIASEVTKADVGLGNVDNTSDANKPVSTAQQTALDVKASYNWIINGDFTINQRGGVKKPANGVYGYDRWKGHADGIEQIIEALPAGEYTLTWSGGGNGTFGGVTAVSPIKATVAGDNTSVVVPQTATKVSVVAGDATAGDPWQARHSQQELALCQRYYETGTAAGLGQGNGVDSFVSYLQGFFAVQKRVAPTVLYTTQYATNAKVNGSSITATVSRVIGVQSTNAAGFSDISISWRVDAEI